MKEEALNTWMEEAYGSPKALGEQLGNHHFYVTLFGGRGLFPLRGAACFRAPKRLGEVLR